MLPLPKEKRSRKKADRPEKKDRKKSPRKKGRRERHNHQPEAPRQRKRRPHRDYLDDFNYEFAQPELRHRRRHRRQNGFDLISQNDLVKGATYPKTPTLVEQGLVPIPVPIPVHHVPAKYHYEHDHETRTGLQSDLHREYFDVPVVYHDSQHF